MNDSGGSVMWNLRLCKALFITIRVFLMALPVLAQPEIEVVVRASNEWCSWPENMTDGGAYDSYPIKRVVEFKIIISNTGSADLNLNTPLTLIGPGAGILEWVQQPAAVVGPQSSTEAKFLITGGTKGWNTANLAIGNNDPDESPFDITLNILVAESHLLGQYFNGDLISYDGFTYDWPVDVAIGETSEVDVYLINYDTDGPSCSVGDIEFTGNPYIAVNGNSAFTLTQPQDAVFFYGTSYKIHFTPTAAGTQTAEISFRYKAAGTRVFFPFNFTVRANPLCPDIRVQDIFVIDGEGPDITCKIRVCNRGMAATRDKFKNRIYLSADEQITDSDYQINDWNVHVPLGIDASQTSWDIKSMVTGVPPGEYYLGVIADAKSVIPESDENNNTGYNDLVKVVIPESGLSPSSLDVPLAALPPVIDGIPDPVWFSTASHPLTIPGRDGNNTPPEEWLDCYAQFRMMVDETSCYLLIEAFDDMPHGTAGTDDLKDAFTLVFAAADSGDRALSVVDPQVLSLRYEYGEDTEITGRVPGSVCKFANSNCGYNLEIELPAESLLSQVQPGQTFAFDLRMTDIDASGPEHTLTWSSTEPNLTSRPDLMGTARIIDYQADSPMIIPEGIMAPVIDGSVEEAAWENIPWISADIFVDNTDGNPLNPPFDMQTLDDWNDCRTQVKFMWMDAGLYFFANVLDDRLVTDHADYWMNDGFQIFIDANNDKTTTGDANDEEFNFRPSGPASDHASEVTAGGWTLEALIDITQATGIVPSAGRLIGLEVQLNDNDGPGRDLWRRWWGNDDAAWSNPSLWGTAKLEGEVTALVPSSAETPVRFSLDQNYPNPFNPSTTIQYDVPMAGPVRLTVHDLLGREVAVLVNESRPAGTYKVTWNADHCAAGIYLCRLEAGGMEVARKLVLEK